MGKIIVVTDFSSSSQNALRYACAFCASMQAPDLLLVNIESLPVSYAGDGVSTAAISDTLANRTDKLQDEIEAVADSPLASKIRYRAIIGEFLKVLRELIVEEQATLVFIGTPASYGEVWAWDANILEALTALPVPVLTVPKMVTYQPLKRIAFASIPGALPAPSPIASLKKVVKYTGAALHVVAVVPPNYDLKEYDAAQAELKEQLADTDAVYHHIQEQHIVQAIGRFVEDEHIDMLVVRPRRHGLWYNLFHKSYTKELARLNLIPVMALHDEWNVA